MPPLCSQMSFQSCAVVSCTEQRIHPTLFHLPAFLEDREFLKVHPIPPPCHGQGSPLCTGCSERQNSLGIAGSLFPCSGKPSRNRTNSCGTYGSAGRDEVRGRALGWLHIQAFTSPLLSELPAFHSHTDQVLPSLTVKGSRKENKTNFFFFQFNAILINCDRT